jgi:hypothetical protein
MNQRLAARAITRGAMHATTRPAPVCALRTINAQQASAMIIATSGRFFGCSFIKRTNGERRDMWCRYAEVGELKGTGRRSTPQCPVVWDDHAKGWRSFYVDSVIELRIDGQIFSLALTETK